MLANSTHVVRFLTTPKELRQLADEMEKLWAVCKWGESTVVRTIHGPGSDPILELKICIDQQRLTRELEESLPDPVPRFTFR